MQLDAGPVLEQHQLCGQTDTANDNDRLICRQMCKTAPTYIIAPHLYSKRETDLVWFFSEPLRDRGWIISTHQFERSDIGFSPAQRLRGFLACVVYSTLHTTGLSACENSPCAMNNSDGLEEMIVTPMVLCPGCLRKLLLISVMPDVPGGLRSLRECLASLAGSPFDDDLATLASWGVGESSPV